jgi:hypothetical protein
MPLHHPTRSPGHDSSSPGTQRLAGKPPCRSRFRHTRTGKAQIQAVQIESQALRVHAPELAAQSAHSCHVVSLQTSAASPYDLDIKVISTIHASIFANSAALAGTSR